MKKFISLLLALGLTLAVTIPAAADPSGNNGNGNGNNGNGNGNKATATSILTPTSLDDNFVPGHVEVVLAKSQSKINKIWAKSSFSAAKIEAINDLTKFTGNAASTALQDAPSLPLLNTGEFRQILDITLTDKTKQGVLDAIAALQNNPNLEYVGPDYITTLAKTPNDTYYASYQWGLPKINAPAAWDITTGSSSVLVGVLDTGIDATHPDLAGRINTALGVNFTGDSYGMTDPYGHGTHVAGIIGAAGNNGVGVCGVNWNVTMVSERVFDSNGNGYFSWLASAITYAIQNNIPILNYSGGGLGGADATVLAALNNYKGIFICAAGNNGLNTDTAANYFYPAYYSAQCANVVSVGASTTTDSVATYSNYGATTVNLFAPGGSGTTVNNPAYDIQSTYPVAKGSYYAMSGTSMATPMVTGVAALMKSVNPNITPAQIKSYLMNTTDKLSAFSGKCVSGGRLNAYNAVKAAAAYTVVFNANGGTGTMANQTFTYNVAQALSANAFTRTGYTFLGWSTSPSATTPTYTDKQSVINLTTGGGTATLYAVWQAATVKVTGVTLNAGTAMIGGPGGFFNLVATISPSNATNTAVTWSSSNPTAITVDANGKVTAVKSGRTVITVKTADGGYTAICTVYTYGNVASAGFWHNAFLTNGTVWTWGYNVYGALGNGTMTNSNVPVKIGGNLNGYVVSVAAGGYHTLALKCDGTVWAWGWNRYGQLGQGTNGDTTSSSTLVQVKGLSDIITIAANANTNIALKSDGTVWTWGYNYYGQVGDGTTTDRLTPAQVSGLTGVVSVAMGAFNTVAVKSDGTVWAWGNNSYGQLGTGVTAASSAVPVQVSGLSGIVSAASGYYNIVALKSDGTVWSLGENDCGKLGNGSAVASSSTPVQASGLTGITAVSTGCNQVLALKSDGTAWSWGGVYQSTGCVATKTPVQISGVSGAVGVSASTYGNMVLKSDGTVWDWGSNQYGTLGNNSTADSFVPVHVLFQ